ncbi:MULTISPECIES: NTP transferase domain-containing protein [unclassified Ruegeria]|uniref:nucleotidyltransferase family protein n=1 Tax=unclassified Ruegeria TaxID=2625375 RepID=UPI001489EB24|nr:MULTISPECIES: nucleotidyltransferase family protein [unclassified Ruegeria]
MTSIPIILLAAGRSSRMRGEDKLMQQVDGIPLLRRTAQRALTVGPVIAALPPQPHPRYAALDGLDVQTVEIPNAAEGMNASLRGALEHVGPDAPAVMILLADLPDLTTTDIQRIRDCVKPHPDKLIWRGADQHGAPGHPVVFHQDLLPELLTLTGDTGARSVLENHKDRLHLEPLPGRHATLDLDTPEDWVAWREDRQA